MTTAIVGSGNIGLHLGRSLVQSGERVVLVSRSPSQAVAKSRGKRASTASDRAIAEADV